MQGVREGDWMVDKVEHGGEDEDKVTVQVDWTNEHEVDDEDTVTLHMVSEGVEDEGVEDGCSWAF